MLGVMIYHMFNQMPYSAKIAPSFIVDNLAYVLQKLWTFHYGRRDVSNASSV